MSSPKRMAKFFFAVVLLTAMVAVSLSQLELDECAQRFQDLQCQPEVQQMPLHACWQLLDRELSGLRVVVPSWMTPYQPRAQCCEQLQDVSPECRCSAIRGIVRSLEQSLVPLEGGYGGETGGQQQGGYYGGERRQQEGEHLRVGCGQQGGYYGETGRQQAGWRCSQTKQNRGYIGFPPRVRLARMREYARQLPAMCRIEPQECSIFVAGPYSA
jgi:hypothetical protein